MQIKIITASLFVFVFVLTGVANAQFGVVRKLVSVPTAELPEAAKQTGLGGRVMVQVTVDESGKVTSVGQASGPDQVCQQIVREDVVALREAAREVAANAIFEPAANASDDQTAFLAIEFEGDTSISKLSMTITGEGTVTNKSAATEEAKADGNRYTVIGTPVAPPATYSGPVNASGGIGSGALSPGKSLSGGILNGKATSLPKPPYPPAARAVKAAGAVTIQVLITEEGQVFAAGAVSGHPLLRPAARIAACGAEFLPTILSGNPVKVSGVITYNFVAP